jgi:hypothetical protein
VFTFLEDYFDDLEFGFVFEVFGEILFLCDVAMGSILEDLVNLEYFGHIIFYTVSVVEYFVTIAGYFEVFVVCFVTDYGDVCHLDVC